MSQIIDFANFRQSKSEHLIISNKSSIQNKSVDETEYIVTEDDIRQTRELLLQQFPGRINYSQKEAAEVLNVSYQFINQKCKEGKIKSVPMGNRILININEISRIINEGITNEYQKTA